METMPNFVFWFQLIVPSILFVIGVFKFVNTINEFCERIERDKNDKLYS